MKVTMPGGVGILVPEPLAAPDEVQSRLPVTVDVKEKLGQRWYLYYIFVFFFFQKNIRPKFLSSESQLLPPRSLTVCMYLAFCNNTLTFLGGLVLQPVTTRPIHFFFVGKPEDTDGVHRAP